MKKLALDKCFNGRTHTGCDYSGDRVPAMVNSGVSIHAPTRGATRANIRRGYGHMFQSTHSHGVRPCAKLHIISQ